MAASELNIDTTATALEMADTMFGSGVTVVSATYTGANTASGIYTGGDVTAPVLTPSDSGVILSTGLATDITNSTGAENVSPSTSTDHALPGDAGLTSISGITTFDAAILESTFIPDGDVLTMQIVFSSEEYLEYVNSGVNDAVGIWVNGVKAELSITDGNISIDEINDTMTSNLFLDNTGVTPVANTEMDGLTITLSLKAPVNPDEENTIRIGIADGGDGVYDSNLLIVADSLQTSLIANDDTIELFGTNSGTIDALANDESGDPSLTITEINGQPIVPGGSIVLATGETITLNANGTLTLESDGALGSDSFSYTIADSAGNTDVGYITATTSVACFVAGSLIDTPSGPVKIEQLEVGDEVLTSDNGPQVLRWIGSTTRLAKGRDAPIRFRKGALGNHEEIEVSPNHRVLVRDGFAELLFGSLEVFVKAKHLVNDATICRRVDDASVTYVHLLFDRHEIVTVNGLESESFHPGAVGMAGFDPETAEELHRFFPCLDAIKGYGSTARMDLRAHEALTLLSA